MTIRAVMEERVQVITAARALNLFNDTQFYLATSWSTHISSTLASSPKRKIKRYFLTLSFSPFQEAAFFNLDLTRSRRSKTAALEHTVPEKDTVQLIINEFPECRMSPELSSQER